MPDKELHRLRGTYAYSHSIFWWADPPYTQAIPQLHAVYESPTNRGTFNTVIGYALTAFAGYIHFDGNGNLTGGGYNNRGGIKAELISYTGTYTVDTIGGGVSTVYTGKITTLSGTTEIDHYFVAADGWKELKFTMLETRDIVKKIKMRGPVTAGVMTRV